MTPTTVERRAHTRQPHRIEIEGPPDQQGTIARMMASDLSLGGLHCSSSRDYAEMTRLAVRLVLTDGPIDVEAVVVHRTELPSASDSPRYELGLFFTAMSDESRERLTRFLAANAPN